MSTRRMAQALAMVALGCAPQLSHAETDPTLEYNRLTRPSDTIGTLGAGLFGDSVDLYSGVGGFDVTDISLPGNSSLPVALGRHLDVKETDLYGGLPSFSNWEVDVPYLTGYFSEAGWQGTVGSPGSTTGTNSRCSLPSGALAIPPAVTHLHQTDYLYGQNYWSGNMMYVPGAGTQEMLQVSTTAPNISPAPTTGGPYKWITKNLWVFSCLSSLQSGGAGEGFLAISPDGTKYYFDKMMGTSSPATSTTFVVWDVWHETQIQETMDRYKYWMLASHVVDRFGNTVTYNYDVNSRLQSIVANDGRTISLMWNADGTIATASAGSHTWTYNYASYTDRIYGLPTKLLSSVVQPDNAAWGYQYTGDLYLTDPTPPVPGDPVQHATCEGDPIPGSRRAGAGFDSEGLFTMTATHPSGASGVFTFKSVIHGRSYDPHKCTGASPIYPKESENFALFSKVITGPGLPGMTWNYSYSGTDLDHYNSSWDVDCPNNSCTDTVWTKVANPDGSEIKSIFGNRYGVTEGQLKETIVYSSTAESTVLDDVANTYWGYVAGQAFPQFIGVSPQFRANIFLSQEQHPLSTTVTTRDGVNFTTSNNAFDLYAKATSTTGSSTLGYARTDVTTYDANTNLWVIEQPKKLTNSNTGVVVFDKTFDAATALPQTVSQNGLLKATYTFFTTDDANHQKGLLNTVKDALNHTTTLSNYFRGVPQSLQFPNTTSKTAAVDNDGHIVGLTDEMGYAMGFAYDPMGRLATVTQPAGDTVAWTPTTITFAQIASTEYGLPAGHWKQTETTGNANKVTYFDAFWQPVLTKEYDSANVAATTRITTQKFDDAGRSTFKSYPVAAIAAYNSATNGAGAAYDALGRPTINWQDSELGMLTTTFWYLPGFQTKVTNPRAFATTTSYQAFGSPDTSAPVQIVSPEGITTTMTRDVFGKPLTMTRSGTWAGSPISTTRSYVYDTKQRLCKRVEPETGATVMDYDAANNLAWTVTGSSLTTVGTSAQCETDRGLVPGTSKTVRTYDTLNRPLAVDVPSSTNDIAYAYFNDGALQTLTSGPTTWSYTYNKRRLPITETLTLDSRVKTITHAYDVLGHESTLTYPSTFAVSTAPNALGQPTGMGMYATGVTYFPNGGMSAFTYGNAIVHSLTQNTRQLPLRSLDKKASVAAVLDDSYAYDPNGNVNSITDGTAGAPNTRTMVYDTADRLTSTHAANQPWVDATTSYDPLDNIRTNQVGTTSAKLNTYAYDPVSARLTTLTGRSNWTLSYDAFGNVIGKGAGQDSYVFDAANRMTSVTGKESYVYDGYGRRVKVTRTSDGLIDYPIYTMTGQLLEEDDQRNAKTIDYLSLNGSLVAKRATNIGTQTNLVESYEHTDALHSPVTETNTSAAVTTVERYTPLGEPSDGNYTQGPGFTGHVTDAATGLTYAQQRYYDPIVGRFLGSDPVLPSDNGANFNRYWYANNNPYRFTDPDGRSTCANADCSISTIDHTVPRSNPQPPPVNGDVGISPSSSVGRNVADGYTATVTFVNDEPKNPSPDLPVTTGTANTVEHVITASGARSVNINSTSGGHHGTHSLHGQHRAVDIDRVNGQRVGAGNSGTEALQRAAHQTGSVRENYGPGTMERRQTPGGDTAHVHDADLQAEHRTHVHVGGQN